MGYDFNIDLKEILLKEDNIFRYLEDYNTIYCDSGRTCNKLLTSGLRGKELLVPAFSSVSVLRGFPQGVKLVFYAVNRDFTIDFDDLLKKITSDTGGIYITNYFGRRTTPEDAEIILKLKKNYRLTIIEDNTQSIFSGEPKVGDYCMSSIRKWFPVPDGGVIYSKKDLSFIDISDMQKGSRQNDKLYPQMLKTLFLDGSVDVTTKKIADMFASVEKELDEYTDKNEMYLMSDFTRFVFSCYEIKIMIEKRRENEKYLRTLIDSPFLKMAIPKREEDECPFNLPMYCTKRDKMWKYLVDNFNIYPSVLWRTHLYDEVNKIGPTKQMGEQIISFPVDQRYTKEDMRFMAEAINGFKG